MFGATPASSGFTFAPPATASQPPEAAVAKELLESIKKVASIDQAFQVMHDNLAQKAAFLELRPLHALVRSPPIAGSFNATMAEKVLSFFATHTPPILEQESAEHYTPLMQACVRGDLDAVRFFLDKGADINKEVSWQSAGWFSTRESHTPLQLACKHAQVAVTQLLLERGADAGAGLPLLFVVLQNSALSHANKMALGMALLPHTNLTNYWPQLLNTLVNCHQALPLFQKLLTLDDKIKEWKFPPHQNPLIQLIDVGGGDALPEWIDELLRNGHKFDPPIDVNAARANNGTPVVLFSIARSRPAAVIKTLVKHGADPNARDESGQVPLLAACATSQGVIDELLAAGADIFAVGPDGRTALHAALRYGHGALARSFIEKGVDTNARDASGNTALGYALVYDRWDVVDKLLTDANLDEPIQWLLHRPMMRSDKEAQDRERARVIQKRLAAGKKPPRRNYEQENELYELVDDHVTHSVKAQEYQRLAGVNSQMLDARGKTPLLFCVAAGWTAVMMRILARRPELSWQTCNIAADWDGLASRYEGMRVDISPAAYAALHGQTKALKLLFKYADGHLDVNAWMEWDGVRQQYIHTFLNRSDDQIALQSLSVLASLGQPVEVNNRDKRGRTPLHHAASRELPWCVWRLLQLGADPSIVDNWGNSPLAYAANASAWDICRQLLSAGADLNAFYQPPRKGRNPRERKGALIGILVQGIPVEVLKAITEGQQLAPEHMYELLVDSQFDFVHHLLKKLRAENKLHSFLSAQQCSKGPLFAFTKNTASDLSSKPAQKVLKLLFAAVKDYGCTARNERGDTLLTALAREQQPDADSSEDSPKDQARFAALTLALIAHGVDLAERNVDGDTFFHVVARDHQSTELLKSLLAAIHSERAQRLAQPQTSTSTTAAAEAKMEGVEGGEQDMDVECAAAAAAAAAKPEPGAAGGEDEKSKPPEEGSLEARVKRALEVRNGRGQTPLLTAVRPFAHAACRNTEVMSLLLALGANPQDREHGTGNTALFYAVMTDNQAGVRKLLELGLDINGANDKGETPLFVAGRQNLWKMSLFLLLSGANPHAINEAGECVLLVSSGFCAAIIHDFVARPRSLSFIVGALFPELVAGLPNYRPAANEPAAITTTSTPLPAAMTSSSSSLPQASHTDSGNSSESAKSEDDSKAKEKNEEGNENEAEQEAEEPPKTLLDNFPEILHQLNDVDTATGEGGPASSGGLRKREQNKRQRMNAAVKQVTELLRRVLDALQLYEGALDEADVAPDSNSSGDQGDEQHRRARWERNASLTRLKEQLAGWLRKSEARIPRITRNLSFTTLSEGEMALYLRQWKSLRRQRNQRKRKRGEEVEEDFFAETSSSQPQEEWIDVKRPRLEGQGQGDDGDGDDLPLPPLTVPEVESIPLPPPFVLFDDAVPFDALAPLLIRRTRSLVAADAKAAIPSASNSGASYKAQEDDDDDSVDLDDDADKTGVDTGVGLLAEEGYLLDASLTKVDDVEQPAKLQALFVRSKVTAVNVDKGSGNEAEKTTVMDVESTDNKSEAKESESENENKREAESEESEKKKEEQNVGSEWRCGFFVWDSIEEIEEFDTREAALAEFKRRFAKFTGHAWDDRAHFRHDHDNEAEDDEAPVVDTNTATTNDGDKAEQQGSSAMAVDDVDKEKAKEEKEEEKKNEKEEKEKDEEEKESGGYCYLPTDHRAVLRHRRYSKLYGDEEEEGSEDEEEQQEDDNLDDDEESDGEEESLRAKQKKEPSADQRLYDMLAFISHKKRLWSFCNRVGLFEITDMGQLTSTQIKNAYRILNVLSGILTYKKEMKARKRAVPEKVSQAIGELSNQFHRVLPFNFHGHSLSLNINKRKILAEKLNLLQSLQEIGIGMEVLHEVALPYKRRLMGDDEEELPTQDALSLPLDDDEDHLQQTTPTTTMPLEEKERLERAAGEINEDHPLDRKTSDSAQAMARMQLLCAALRARLTPVDKSSDEWKVIVRLMSTSSVKVLDAFEVEREGEKERFQPFAALPYRSLLCHGTGVYNILGILRKGMCIAPKEANGSGTNFGKGLYFADFPDKSVSYMSSDHGKGCFFLCDVALGEPLVRTSTGFRQPLPPGRHHCWGVGKTITHPEAVLYTDGGLRIPMGEDKRPRAGMGHNEFIVYNEGQVRIRYLLLVQEGA